MDHLEYVREFGCRILVITTTHSDKNGALCIESSNGELIRLSTSDLYDFLKPKEGYLSVDVVFINVRNGHGIAKVFQRLGVNQIFTYETVKHREEVDKGESC